MFREGPLPVFLHGLVEYVGGALFIALPLLLDYKSGTATAVSIVIGLALIVVAATTDWSLSVNRQIPRPVHFALDWMIAALLVASPFIFGFSKERTPTAIFIAAGVIHLLLTIGTRFGPAEAAEPALEAEVEPATEPATLEPAADRPVAADEPPATTGDRRSPRRS
jgi:hypothetical protein